MIEYHDCGLQLQVEYCDAGGTSVRVYCYDDQEVTVCPNCCAPLPTELMQPGPDDDPFLWDDADPDLIHLPTPPDDEDTPCTPDSS